MARLVWGPDNPIVWKGASGTWTNLPVVRAEVEEVVRQLQPLDPSTDYLFEASYNADYSDPVTARFTTALEDLRNKLGEVRVNGNAIVGWNTSRDLEFDTTATYAIPALSHAVTIEADPADPDGTVTIDRATQSGGNGDTVTFQLTVSFGQVVPRTYTLRVTISAPESIAFNTLPVDPSVPEPSVSAITTAGGTVPFTQLAPTDIAASTDTMYVASNVGREYYIQTTVIPGTPGTTSSSLYAANSASFDPTEPRSQSGAQSVIDRWIASTLQAARNSGLSGTFSGSSAVRGNAVIGRVTRTVTTPGTPPRTIRNIATRDRISTHTILAFDILSKERLPGRDLTLPSTYGEIVGMTASITDLWAITVTSGAATLHKWAFGTRRRIDVSLSALRDQSPETYRGLMIDPSAAADEVAFYSFSYQPTAINKIQSVRWEIGSGSRTIFDVPVTQAYDLTATSASQAILVYSDSTDDTDGDTFARIIIPTRRFGTSTENTIPVAANDNTVSLTSGPRQRAVWALDIEDNRIYAYNPTTGVQLP